MRLKYQNGFIFEGHTFVVNKSDIRNAKDEQFVEGVALLPEVHGRPLKVYCDPYTGRMFTTCSVCDGKIGKTDTFCKHCGARMDGGGGE